jgi:hypothetical protein
MEKKQAWSMVAQEEVERTLEVTLFHGRISQEENVVVGKEEATYDEERVS